ncbi:histidine N-acetyltransferase-like isoform X2 [Scyliorhinus canicula]|uniref:histidine N-acetyltransferase-like isoform X2 n=1 Tax=Scyliorhinus canicula TaxID=7830 RepID=UPI0018F79F1C|nr:histidine N-acetyltransferase-like isoform X2 [Scyliorhinus canicula]
MGLSLSTCNRAMMSSVIHSYLRAPGGRPMGRPGVRSYTTRQYSESDLDFCLATEKDFGQVQSLYNDETDYMPSVYHSWLRERNRMVMLAKHQGQLIGVCSSHIVDDGQANLIEVLKVAASERGKGAARLTCTHLIDLVRARYPEVKKQRFITDHKLNRGLCVLGKQSLISLQVPSINVPTLISEVISNMKKRGDEYYEPIPLQPDDVRLIFLNRTVIDTLLPGGRIVQRGSVFKPLESNLDILLKRDIVWRADRKVNPRAVSLGTAPYRDPMGNCVFMINMFGQDLSAVKCVFLSQLQSLPPLQDNVICLLSVNPSLSPQMWEFCINEMGLEKGKQYWNDEIIVEDDISQRYY